MTRQGKARPPLGHPPARPPAEVTESCEQEHPAAIAGLRLIHGEDGDPEARREALRARAEQLDELAKLYEAAKQRAEELAETCRIHDELLPLVLNEKGLQAIVDTGARLAGKPVMVFDRFDRVIAHADTADEILRTSEIALGPHLRMYFNRDGARPDFVAIGGQRFLVVPLTSDGRTLGNLCLHYAEPPASDRDVIRAGHVGHFVTLELLKQRIRLDVTLRLNIDFFGSLISDAPDSQAMLANRASLLGLDLVHPSAALMVRITPMPDGDWFDILSIAAWRLRTKLAGVGASGAVFPTSSAEIVVVVNADPAPLLRDQILPAVRATFCEVLARHGSDFTIDIGVGTVEVGIDGIRASYDTAAKALSLIDALGLRDRDLDLRDFATYSLLLDVREEEQEKYIQRVLGPIFDYDAQHSTELVKTLECYVDMLGSVQRTAEALYLHPTTVRYRLARIEELASLQLDNSEHRLTLSLALRLHRLYLARTQKGRGSLEDGGNHGD
jgi:sugar diacid utilization regulator